MYLAQDDNKQLFAIKTIRCKMGKEVAQNAIKEAIITNRFQHKNIIKIEVSRSKHILIALIFEWPSFQGHVYDQRRRRQQNYIHHHAFLQGKYQYYVHLQILTR